MVIFALVLLYLSDMNLQVLLSESDHKSMASSSVIESLLKSAYHAANAQYAVKADTIYVRR
jgi:hypothetical protein